MHQSNECWSKICRIAVIETSAMKLVTKKKKVHLLGPLLAPRRLWCSVTSRARPLPFPSSLDMKEA